MLIFLCPLSWSFIVVILSVGGCSVELSSYFQLSFRFSSFAPIGFGCSRVGSSVVAAPLKGSLRHYLIIWEFDLFCSIRIFFGVVVCQIAALALKLIVTYFYLSFWFELLASLGGVVEVVSCVGTHILESTFRHDMVLWKCNFIRSPSSAFVVVIVHIARLPRELSSYFQLSFALDGLPSYSLRVDVVM
jgi:hypothetical protein